MKSIQYSDGGEAYQRWMTMDVDRYVRLRVRVERMVFEAFIRRERDLTIGHIANRQRIPVQVVEQMAIDSEFLEATAPFDKNHIECEVLEWMGPDIWPYDANGNYRTEFDANIDPFDPSAVGWDGWSPESFGGAITHGEWVVYPGSPVWETSVLRSNTVVYIGPYLTHAEVEKILVDAGFLIGRDG